MASSEGSGNTLKYALMGVGAVALAGALYYLSQDESSNDDSGLDKKKFSKDRLRKLLEETLLEYTCIICRNYNLMLKVKEAQKG